MYGVAVSNKLLMNNEFNIFPLELDPVLLKKDVLIYLLFRHFLKIKSKHHYL